MAKVEMGGKEEEEAKYAEGRRSRMPLNELGRLLGSWFNEANIEEGEFLAHFVGKPFGDVGYLIVNVLEPCAGGPSTHLLYGGVGLAL